MGQLIQFFCTKFKMSNVDFQLRQQCIKSVRIRSFSGPYFLLFGLNTESPNLSVFSPNEEKHGPEKLRIRTLFTQCKCLLVTNRQSYANGYLLLCLVSSKEGKFISALAILEKVDAESLGPPTKFQVKIKIQLNAACVYRISFRFMVILTRIIPRAQYFIKNCLKAA